MTEESEDISIWGKLGKKGTEGLNHINLDDMDSLSYSFGDTGEKKRKSKS